MGHLNEKELQALVSGKNKWLNLAELIGCVIAIWIAVGCVTLGAAVHLLTR